jgi:hypothetical protein
MRKALLLMTALFSSYCALATSQKTLTIKEPAGLDWTGELIHSELTFKPGELTGKAMAKVTQSGGKAILSQVSDIVRNDDQSIRSMTVWFMADVKSNQTVSFTIQPGEAGPAAKDSLVNQGKDTLALVTPTSGGRIGIRLPSGKREFDWPVPATTVSGPVQALLLPSGRETGTGKLDVPFLVKSMETELTASGPLFAEARVTYTFDTGFWIFKAKVIRDCPMIVVSEELDNGDSKLGADQFDRFYTLRLNGADYKPDQFYFTGRNDREDLQGLLKAVTPDVWAKAGHVQPSWFASPINGFTPTYTENRVDFHLTGYPSVIARLGCLARLVETGRDAVGFAALNLDSWKNPMSLWFGETTNGEFQVRLPLQAFNVDWVTDGFGKGSPNYTGKALYVPPTLTRRSYGIMLSPAENEATNTLQSLFAQGSKLGSYPLDTVKDWIVEWPDPMAGAAWTNGPTAAATNQLPMMRDLVTFYKNFGHYAQFSMGFHYNFAKNQYIKLKDVIDNPAALTAAERAEMRRLCAFLASDMHTTARFPWGTGFHLNNPNMSMMAMEARVKSAMLVKGHPMIKPWGEWTSAFVKDYNRRFIKESGATYENPHYTLGVTYADILEINHLLMESGIPDSLNDPLFDRSTRFIMDWLTPPDPRFLGHRVILPLGNCSYQSVPVTLARPIVEYYQTRDLERAGQLQWFANQTLPTNLQVNIVQDKVPDLKSVFYPEYGVSFRHGFGTPYETLFLLFAGTCDGHCEWETDQLTYTFYAKGQPINLHFGNGYMPMFVRPWLRNRVSIDHKIEVSERNITRVESTAFSPETEYARAMRQVDQLKGINGEFPILKDNKWTEEENKNWSAASSSNIVTIPPTIWYRQVLFMKDPDPKGPNYFVLRDTFSGTPTLPTDLSFWFLANTMNRTGNMFHFDGQCKVDMDMFVNTPDTFEPETNRYGHTQTPYGRSVKFDPAFHPDGKLQETQLMLRLKQPVGKGYMVVLYPRLKDGDPAASFTRLTDSAVKVDTPVSTDYAFMNAFPTQFKDDKVEFDGLAASVRFYKDGRIAVANSEGKAAMKVAGKTITGNGPFVVTLAGNKVTKNTYAAGASVDVQ